MPMYRYPASGADLAVLLPMRGLTSSGAVPRALTTAAEVAARPIEADHAQCLGHWLWPMRSSQQPQLDAPK